VKAAARHASAAQRAMGVEEDSAATATLLAHGMAVHDIDVRPWRPAAEALWVREARALDAVAWLEAARG
jgi:hypothetical protein